MKKCTKDWHVFEGGLPKDADVCKCGRMQATDKIGVLVAAPTPKKGE